MSDMPPEVRQAIQLGLDSDFYRQATSTEPLHPDLAPWMEEDGPIGPMLKHPLVYELLPRPGIVNARYLAKKERLAEALAEGNWWEYVYLHSRPYRATALAVLKAKVGDRMSTEELAHQIAWVWTDSENIHECHDAWDDLLEWMDPEARRHLMDEEELAEFDALPERITVYRGCIADLNEDGLSWTLERKTASWFARRFAGLREGEPRVLVGTVDKADVIAYFTSRNEAEIVVANGEVNIERIEEV